MELNNLVFDKYSVSGLKKKLIVYSISLTIFVVLFMLSVALFIASFMRAVNDTLNFVLVMFLILANILYIVSFIIMIVKTKKITNKVNKGETVTQKLQKPIKLDLDKKFSTLEIIFIVCDAIIALGTIFTIISLCIYFKFELLANLGLMLLIFTYSISYTILMLIEKEMYKFMCLKQKQSHEQKIEDNVENKIENNNQNN